MAPDDRDRHDSAPDLRILGDRITLQPSGFVEPPKDKDGKDEALMKKVARFRSEPLRFLRDVSLYVSGTGWRAYDDVIGQPIFYSGFSEHIKTQVMSATVLQTKIAQLADLRISVEEQQGFLPPPSSGREYEIKKAKRRAELVQGLQEVAEHLTDNMICKFESKSFIRGAYYLVTQLLLRAYHQGIHVSSEEVLRLRNVAEEAEKKKQSIIFLPCHRSHVDYVAQQLLCYRLGLALPVVVAGDNLNFPLVGSFLQHAGAMYIRRSFGDDQLYTTLVQAYIDVLLQGGYNLECFIEGGRSRTGKLLPPKFGILSFVLDSLLSGRVEDAIICPVSTQYDKVIETEGYVTELGRVDVRFHEPWSLRGFIDDQINRLSKVPSAIHIDWKDTKNQVVRQKLLRTLGYKVLADINDVSVVMPTALIGTVLLTLRGRGVGRAELIRRVEWLTERRGLEVLGKDLVGVVEGLAEPTYYAVDRFQLSFYRNMTIHLFISEALVAAALYTKVKQGGGPAIQDIPYQELHDQVLFLSSLFRGEFIYSGEGLQVNLERTLAGLEADNIIMIERDEQRNITKIGLSDAERAAGRENYDFYCFLIWPFIEASWLAAVSLMGLTPPLGQKDDVWIQVSRAQDSAQFLGKTLYHQGDLSYFEAVNKETLKNSYQRFEEEGIIQVVKSKDSRIPPRLRVSPEWRPSRDEITGNLTASGKLWDFTEKIASSRREGKNRRDGATVSTRAKGMNAPARLSEEEERLLDRSTKERKRRRTLENRAHL
ncbi:hypothetical protein B0T21DRAFT_360657 [Apiosordaria backusii]|uniref:Phospholipid/glycerol acyltransferase domain-containing protein n=1 Tax=Apiosordaria backusii TaxID=314023 RepID=A0AA40K149_9PEZI|nr:hypothetical protein B0T21DRAFT_360657 [Apiosordaria backusii]